METPAAELNLVLAWAGIVAGIAGGFLLGLNFHRENWLGGYSSLRRRLLRLAHISMFGLAIINLLFYFTVRAVAMPPGLLQTASWGFGIGAVTMPLCCVLMAGDVRWRSGFAVPVLSLLVAAGATLWGVLQA